MPRRRRRGCGHLVVKDAFAAASDLANRPRLVVVVPAGSVALPEALAVLVLDMTDPDTGAGWPDSSRTSRLAARTAALVVFPSILRFKP